MKHDNSSFFVEIEKACRASPQGQTLRQWRDLAKDVLPFSDLAAVETAIPKLSYLTIDTTAVCDLTCNGMCYYHPAIDIHKPAAPLSAFERAIVAANTQLGLQTLIFSGKEPLLNPKRFFHLMEYASRIQDRRFKIGFVTNGRRLARHWRSLDALVGAGALTFLDISLDSALPGQHDEIRGVDGTFALARAALERCCKEWPSVRVGTASTLRHDNASGILGLVSETAHFNKHFFVAPVQPPPFTTTAPLQWSQIREFLHELTRLLRNELRGQQLEIMVSLLGLYLEDAVHDGFLRLTDIQEDAQGQCFVEHWIGGNRLQFQLQVIPETGRRVGRILHTGAYLPNAHFLQTADPERFAVGFVQDLPLLELYRRAVAADSVLGKMLSSRETHTCRGRNCWSHCFGGLAAAEHSFVGGSALNERPSLCPKTDEGRSQVE